MNTAVSNPGLFLFNRKLMKNRLWWYFRHQMSPVLSTWAMLWPVPFKMHSYDGERSQFIDDDNDDDDDDDDKLVTIFLHQINQIASSRFPRKS